MSLWDRWQDMFQSDGLEQAFIPELPESEGIVRYHMIFAGRVQGVGFRYTIKLEAFNLSITGWVHNNYDGTVAAELQGENKSIRMLLYRIQQGRYIKIRDIDVRQIPADASEAGFAVK